MTAPPQSRQAGALLGYMACGGDNPPLPTGVSSVSPPMGSGVWELHSFQMQSVKMASFPKLRE